MALSGVYIFRQVSEYGRAVRKRTVLRLFLLAGFSLKSCILSDLSKMPLRAKYSL